jgi:hypothetical protein
MISEETRRRYPWRPAQLRPFPEALGGIGEYLKAQGRQLHYVYISDDIPENDGKPELHVFYYKRRYVLTLAGASLIIAPADGLTANSYQVCYGESWTMALSEPDCLDNIMASIKHYHKQSRQS